MMITGLTILTFLLPPDSESKLDIQITGMLGQAVYMTIIADSLKPTQSTPLICKLSSLESIILLSVHYFPLYFINSESTEHAHPFKQCGVCCHSSGGTNVKDAKNVCVHWSANFQGKSERILIKNVCRALPNWLLHLRFNYRVGSLGQGHFNDVFSHQEVKVTLIIPLRITNLLGHHC